MMIKVGKEIKLVVISFGKKLSRNLHVLYGVYAHHYNNVRRLVAAILPKA